MRKLSRKEAIAVGVSIAVVAAIVVFGSLGFLPSLLPVSQTQQVNTLNNENNADQPADATITANKLIGDRLLVEDERVGTGAEATVGKTITVNYKGTLIDGTQFDSSYDRGTPLEVQIGVGQLIQGWDQGIIGMKVGGKRKLIVPASLGYGDRAIGSIPASSTLVFEVELLGVK